MILFLIFHDYENTILTLIERKKSLSHSITQFLIAVSFQSATAQFLIAVSVKNVTTQFLITVSAKSATILISELISHQNNENSKL